MSAERLTLQEYLVLWLSHHRRNTSPSTWMRYQQSARLYVLPYLGDIRLKRLQHLDISGLYGTLLTDGGQDAESPGLHPRTVKHVHEMLHKALGDAAKWRMVIRNVADAVTAPKVPRRPVEPPDVAQVRRVLGSAKDAGIHPEIYTAIMTGLRPSDLLALRWRDLDLEAGVARVVQAVRRITGHGLVFQETKSHRSTRAIALPPSLAEVLRRHRARQAERRLLVGPLWQDFNLVFPNDVGKPRDPARLLRRFQNALATAGLSRMRLYDLRHWFVSLLLMEGVPLSVVSEAAGHADAGFTKNVYGHIALEAQKEAALRLERRLASDAG